MSEKILPIMMTMAAMGAGMSHRDNPLDGDPAGRPDCPVNKTGCYYNKSGHCFNPHGCPHRGDDTDHKPGDKFVCDGIKHTITKVDGATLTVKPFCFYCKNEKDDLRAIHNKRCEQFMACRKCRRKRGIKI